jgi:ABC-2 type transport system ATP-binding protein
MAQKVQFITTILHEPELLILDEPFSGFDPINAKLIQEEMLRLKSKGATIILSTHDMGSVEELCDDIGLIDQSHLVLSGPVAEVKAKFKENLFEVAYKGTAMELGILMGHQFELVQNDVASEYNIAKIRISPGHNLNNLLAAMMQKLEIVSAREIIPNMNEIFIKAVTQNQKTHE